MEFSVSKSDLVRELNLSQGVVERKTTIPILSNILFETLDGRVQMTATDLELGIRCSCPAKVKTPGSGTIPARKLLDYVRLLPEAEINVKFADNQWANLTCGRSKTRIAGMSRESYPELPEMPEVLAEIPAATLSSLISKTIFAISAEESRFTLNGALLVLGPDGLTMVATDGHRLALAANGPGFAELEAPYKALLPRKAMAELLKLTQDAEADAKVKFTGTENHLFFELGERILLSRKLTGNFPDFERVLPKEQPNSVTIPKEQLRAAIERVAQFSDERSRAIRMQVEDGELKVSSSASETGESEESFEIPYAGPKVEIGFNAQYLLEFLKALPESQSKFLFRDPHSAGELRPASDDEASGVYRYVVMPMRI